jgi:hypothetical protein
MDSKNNHPQKNTLLKTAARQRYKPKFLREYFFLQPRKEIYFFSPILRCFNFFATTQSTTNNLSNSLSQSLTGQRNLTRTTEARTANIGLPQWGLTWLIQVQCFYQSLCMVDSLVLRNPPLRQAEKRYVPL